MKMQEELCYNPLMSERSPQGEKPKFLWVPFRPKSLGKLHKSEYGYISWNPNFIPDGQRLEVEVNAVNRLLQLSNISFPLEIWSYNEPKGDDFEITGKIGNVGKAASIALESLVYRSRKPLDLADFFYDYETNKGIVRINFNGIADRLEEKLPEGRSNPRFYPSFGKMVDQAFKSQMGHVINVNTALFIMENEDTYYSEGHDVLVGMLPASIGGVFALLEIIANHDIPHALNDIGYAIGSFESVYVVCSTLRMLGNRLEHAVKRFDNAIETGKHEDDLWNKLLHGSIDERIQFLYPHNTSKYLLLPYAVNFAWQQPLMRGKIIDEEVKLQMKKNEFSTCP